MAKKIKPKELHPLANRTLFEKVWKTLRNGKPPKLEGKTAITGRLTNPATKRKVTIRINEILDISKDIKIGVMGDISARMDDIDYRKKFDFVNRIYKSSSKQTVIDFEVELIKKFKKSHADKVRNVSENKAGRLTTYNGDYYVYVVYNKL